MNTNEYSNIYEQESTMDAERVYVQPSPNGMGTEPPHKKKDGNQKLGTKMTKCVAYALAFGLVAGTAFQGSSYAISQLTGEDTVAETTTNNTQIAATSVSTAASTVTSYTDVSSVVENVMPSIVAITNMSEVQYQSYFGQIQNYESESAGSGIIVREDDDYLYIATNNHVVSGATSLTVQFIDDSTVSAEIQGTDSTNDLAVVKVLKSDIEAETLAQIKVATLGDSESLAVGEAAIAIGNALGYGQSVTTGVISALERAVQTEDETTGATYTNQLIQTDAAINPGNSGGALLNTAGEVIGINSSKYADTTVEGMGFAIPMATAEPIIDDLIANGTVSTANQGGYLGIAGVDVTSDVSSAYNIPEGIYVTKVLEDTAAQAAGISQGDIITQIDDTEVSSMTELKGVITGHKAGDTVTITYQRRDSDGVYTEFTMDITLGEYPDDDADTDSQQDSDSSSDPDDSQQSEEEQRIPSYGDNDEESGLTLLPELPGSGRSGR